MKKYEVTAEIIRNHFHDGDILFTYNNHSTFDIGDIMYDIKGYDNPDEYSDIFTVIFNGEKCDYWELMEGELGW